MKTITLLSIIFILLCSSCNYEVAVIDRADTDSNIKEALEKAYFEGQKDAINDDVRIKLNSDSIYIWTKSCWDDGTKPIFNPTYLDTKHTTKF